MSGRGRGCWKPSIGNESQQLREQPETKNRNVQQQVEEASGNISENEREKLKKEIMEEVKELVGKQLEQMEECQRITKLEFENKALRAELEHQKLLIAHNAQQTKLVVNHSKRQQLIDALTIKLMLVAECVEERERVEQMELELLKETNRKLEQKWEEWGNNLKDLMEMELQKNIAVIELAFAALNGKIERFEAAKCVESERVERMELELKETNRKLEQKWEEWENNVQQLDELDTNLWDAVQKLRDQLRKH